MNNDVYQIIADSAARWPDLPAIHDEFGTLTFAELAADVAALREKLISLGLTKGQGIGVMGRNSRNFITGVFASLGCGATVMPLSHQLRQSEIDAVLRDAPLHAVLDDQSGLPPLAGPPTLLELRTGTMRWLRTSQPAAAPFVKHLPDIAFVRFTSGTTGKSKGVALSHRSVLERVDTTNGSLQLGTKDCVIWVLPMAYHFMVSVVLYLRFGAAIAICNDMLAKTIIEFTNRFNGTLLYASPMHYRMLASDKSAVLLPTLKKAISTSTAIPLAVAKAFTKRYGIPVEQAYGIIEVGLPIINHSSAMEVPDAVGQALAGYEVMIFDERLQPAPPQAVGQLALRGPGMFDGYLQPPQTRAEVVVDGYFLTGDLASVREDGLIRVVGRKKSVINVSGNKVFPEEVETVLEQYPSVELARVSAKQHSLLGEIVHAEVVLRAGAVLEVEALLSFCRKRLSTYKVPQTVVVVSSLPKTGSGKVMRYSPEPPGP